MLIRPVPLLVQVCADNFALRRFGQISQAVLVFAWGCFAVDWTPSRVLVAVLMVVARRVIFFGLFVGFSCVQFWTIDSTEFANAFTYGGNTITQYPLSIYPSELTKSLTFVLPIAFVNWYPCLYVLGVDDPFGLPVVAAVLLAGRRGGRAGRRAARLADRRASLHVDGELSMALIEVDAAEPHLHGAQAHGRPASYDDRGAGRPRPQLRHRGR